MLTYHFFPLSNPVNPMTIIHNEMISFYFGAKISIIFHINQSFAVFFAFDAQKNFRELHILPLPLIKTKTIPPLNGS